MDRESARLTTSTFWARHGVLAAWLATGILTLPALRAGFLLDDFLQRLVLEGRAPELGLGPSTLYDFTGGGLRLSEWLKRGYVPWFTDPGFAIRFFRPLGSLSIALDQALFGRTPLPSHLAGALLFLAFTAIAFWFFRRILEPARAGLAALIFALESGHSANLTWVAGRHVLVGGIFGALAVAAHVRGRESASTRGGGWVSPAALGASMLASETSLAAGSMIAAYELLVSEGRTRERLGRAAPWLTAMIVYLVAYAAAGYGVRHSLLYISPSAAPSAFVRAMLTRWPILVGELSFALPSFVWGAAVQGRPLFALIGVATTTLVMTLAWRGAATESERRRVRWLAVSAVLGTLPMVGGVPDGRVLLLPSLAGAPLVATALDAAWHSSPVPAPKWTRLAGGVLAFMHLVFAPLVRLGTTELMVSIGRKQRALAESADFSRCAPDAPLFVVTGADPSLCLSGGTALRYYRPDLARRHPTYSVLSLAPHDLELERPSERELVIDVDASPERTTIFERLFRDTPLTAGQSVTFEHWGARVLATAHGVFTRAVFDLPANACLLTLEHQTLVGRPQPPVGTHLHVPHELGPLGL